ncbi:hypothetical protein RRG08_056170 [Elysia crispata]|uniref:Uncharacterized protein n=1 Tax=Elysia crispata TaxID=231223 RepID=A0AAE0Z0N6_9GAST|nr:hypothetical protein RRG08_056170 [Elysia crispata]
MNMPRWFTDLLAARRILSWNKQGKSLDDRGHQYLLCPIMELWPFMVNWVFYRNNPLWAQGQGVIFVSEIVTREGIRYF